MSWLELIVFFGFVAQRQVGETALNDNSSRSHQIIRLVTVLDLFFVIVILDELLTTYYKYFWLSTQTIESTLRENSDCVRSFVASLVNIKHSYLYLLI